MSALREAEELQRSKNALSYAAISTSVLVDHLGPITEGYYTRAGQYTWLSAMTRAKV